MSERLKELYLERKRINKEIRLERNKESNILPKTQLEFVKELEKEGKIKQAKILRLLGGRTIPYRVIRGSIPHLCDKREYERLVTLSSSFITIFARYPLGYDAEITKKDIENAEEFIKEKGPLYYRNMGVTLLDKVEHILPEIKEVLLN